MYWNVIDEHRFDVLEKLVNTISLNDYYMAGGTALALQTGIRESFDFDFFVKHPFDVDGLINELETIGEIKVTNSRTEGTLHCLIDDVQITFLKYEYPLLKPLVQADKVNKLFLANIEDIAAMKLIAISQRGSKKDFFDLYCICNKCNIELQDVFNSLSLKYKENRFNSNHILMSLTYFADAEAQTLPRVFENHKWEDVKDFFSSSNIKAERPSIRQVLEEKKASATSNNARQSEPTISKSDYTLT